MLKTFKTSSSILSSSNFSLSTDGREYGVLDTKLSTTNVNGQRPRCLWDSTACECRLTSRASYEGRHRALYRTLQLQRPNKRI
jgi:hypothetical protein